MTAYEFTLLIDGDLSDDEIFGALLEAGCDDATFGGSNGVGLGEFYREAPSLLEAIASAIAAVESVLGLRVRRVEPDDLVTIPEIAERLGRTPESVRLLANGERGGGTFPPPISILRTRHRLWRWSDIAEWAGQLDPKAVGDARVMAAFNVGLELRELNRYDQKMVDQVGQALGLAS